MKFAHRLVILPVIAIALAFAPAIEAGGRAAAQTAVAPISADPITVMATRGAVETRTLLLRASEPVTGVQIVTLDLSNADGSTVLPAGAIQVSLPSDEIGSSGLLAVPLRFDLSSAPSGEFRGALIVSAPGSTVAVPVSVTVKDQPILPFVVLLAGVALGWGVSWYRSQGRPRDNVLVKIGRFRARAQTESDLGAPFRKRVDSLLIDTEALLRAEKWDEASKLIDDAEALLDKWRKGRDDWQTQLAYHAQLAGRLSSVSDPNSAYIRAVKAALDQAVQEAPDLSGADELRRKLEPLAQQINDYLTLAGLFARIDELLAPLLNTAGGPAAQQRVDALIEQFNALAPGDKTGYDAVRAEAEAIIADLTQRQPARGRDGGAVSKSALSGSAFSLVSPPPTARALTPEQAADRAQWRLRLFTLGSIAIALVLVAGAGFIELYANKPTFGANVWGDYFTLMAWGFGAEATRAAVTELVRSWNLPGASA
ncbi:MAG: hypothetical protein ACUVRU_11180 [Anaerolineae bacterium]